MPYDPDLYPNPTDVPAPAGDPLKNLQPGTDDELSSLVMRLYLENLSQLSSTPVPQTPAPSRKENVLSGLGFNVDRTKTERERPQQEALTQRAAILQNLGALEPILRAHMALQGKQFITPYQSESLDLREQSLTEQERHNKVIEGKPRQALPRTVYNRGGEAFSWNPETGATAPIPLPGGGQAAKPATEADVQASENIKATRLAFSTLRSAAQIYISGQDYKTKVGAFGQQIASSPMLGRTGQSISESVDPQFDLLLKSRQRIINSLAKEVERGRLTDEDVMRAERTLPTAASLSTEKGRAGFMQALDAAEADINARLAARSRLRPGVMNEPMPSVEDDEATRILNELMNEEE